MGAGPSSHSADADVVGGYSDGNTIFTMEDLCGGDFIDDFDIIGASQLGGTPLQPSQDVPTQTPWPAHVLSAPQVPQIVSPTLRVMFMHISVEEDPYS